MFYCTKKLLKDIASIQAGYSIRGKVTKIPDGEIKIIQMKDINQENGIDWESIDSINPISKREPSYIEQTDIIFSGRGTKIFAVTVNKIIDKTVAAPQFFIIKPDKAIVNSFYLSWHINQNSAQIYFKRNAGSALITNVTRQVLENLQVLLPSLQEQKIISKYITAIKKENKIVEQLYQKRNKLLYSIVLQKEQEGK